MSRGLMCLVRGAMAAAALGLGGAAGAEPPPPPATLADAWLTVEAQRPGPLAWQHAFALRDTTAETLPRLRRRLIGDLYTLAVSARVAGNTPQHEGLLAWRARLQSWGDTHIRTPGRLDLPWLAANLRHNPAMERIVHYGVCEPPTWVELWSQAGVMRLDWVPGLSVAQALDALPAAAAEASDVAAIVTPMGIIQRRGIAAWNHEPAPLVPGSRVVLELPSRQGLKGALPFPGTRDELDLINQRLPELLAARIPAEQCRIWSGGMGPRNDDV